MIRIPSKNNTKTNHSNENQTPFMLHRECGVQIRFGGAGRRTRLYLTLVNIFQPRKLHKPSSCDLQQTRPFNCISRHVFDTNGWKNSVALLGWVRNLVREESAAASHVVPSQQKTGREPSCSLFSFLRIFFLLHRILNVIRSKAFKIVNISTGSVRTSYSST